MTSRRARLVLGAWLCAATAFTALGGLRVLAPPFPQAVLFGLLGLLLALHARRPGLRAWVAGLPPRAFLTLHLTRFVGLYFLVLYERGELPYAFAVLGGWGDIAVAGIALALLIGWRGGPPIASWPLQLWNAAGLVDLLFVVATAGRSALTVPGSMAPLTELPLGLLPTFLVPLLLASHVFLALRGWRERGGRARSSTSALTSADRRSAPPDR